MMMWGYDGWSWGWGMLFGGLWMVLFWALIIGLVVWGVNRLSGDRSARGDEPLDILKRRLARGEINPEEFERLKKALE